MTDSCRDVYPNRRLRHSSSSIRGTNATDIGYVTCMWERDGLRYDDASPVIPRLHIRRIARRGYSISIPISVF